MAFMFQGYDEADTTAVTPPLTDAPAENENVSALRTQAQWLLAGSVGLCFIAPPVGACGVVASLVILGFCPLADRMTDSMSSNIQQGHTGAGGLWFALICIGAILVGLAALGGGLLTFAAMAGALMSDIAIMAGGTLLVAWGLAYGRRWGSMARLLLCAFCSCVTVGAIWLRLLPLMGFQIPSVGAQWAAMAGVALFFWWGMDFLSRWGVE